MSVKFFIVPSILLLSSVAYAQTGVDSTSHQPDSISLGEVTVTATPVIRKVDRDVYVPSESVKSRSDNGLSLLKNVQIPSLFVDNVMETISAGGNSVQLRINDRVADIKEVKALQPESIVRVEYLDNPGLRYNGATNVINFVVRNPTVGGSLMVNAMQTIPRPLGHQGINLKLNNGRSQWGVNVFNGSLSNTELTLHTRSILHLADRTVTRDQHSEKAFTGNSWLWSNIYYNYLVPEKTNIYVTVQGFFQPRERNYQRYNTIGSDIAEFLTENSSKNDGKYPAINFYLDQKLGHKQTLVFNISGSWSLTNSRSTYYESLYDSSSPLVSISNRTRGRNFSFSGEANYIKEWKTVTLTTGLSYTQNWLRTQYIEPRPLLRHQRSRNLYAFAEAQMRFGKWNLQAGLGGEYTYSKPEGSEKESDFLWRPRVSIGYRASDASRFSATLYSYSSDPTLSQMTDVVTDEDAYQSQVGNPGLKSYTTYNLSARYMLTLSRLSLQASATWVRAPHKIYDTRYLYDDGNKIMKSYANQSFSRMAFSLAPRIVAIPSWLTISGDITVNRFFLRGPHFRQLMTSWSGNAQVEVTHWGFNLSLMAFFSPSWVNGQDWNRGERISIASLSYNWKNWNFTGGVFCPFGGYSQRQGTDGPYYTSLTKMKTGALNCRPFVRVAYNLQWGHQKRAGDRLIDAPSSEGQGKQGL